MDRRSFLGSILAACAAPAIVRADSLMRIVPRDATVLTSLDDYEVGEWIPRDGDTFDGIISHHGNCRYDRIGTVILLGGSLEFSFAVHA